MLKILVAYNPHIDGVDFEKKLNLSGFELVTAFSGEEAIHFCNIVKDINIMFLTGNLEQNNSFETILEIRKSHAKQIIILLISQFTLVSIRLAVASGCNEVLQLPVREEDMRALIVKYCKDSLEFDDNSCYKNELIHNIHNSTNI